MNRTPPPSSTEPDERSEREALARAMADKLMAWRLPDNFGPDCYISFNREQASKTNTSWPTGTNLFTHQQAVAMLLDIMPPALAATTAPAPTEPVAWAVYWGIGTMRKISVHFERETAERAAQQIKSVTDIRPLYATPPSAVEAAQPEAVGWKRVPIDPTPDMRDAGGRATRSVYSGVWKEHRKPNEVMCAYIYRAMLAAAPTTESTSSPSDAENYSEQLTRAKRLLVDVWQRHPDARSLIEARTGNWFVWGQDRDTAIANKGGKL